MCQAGSNVIEALHKNICAMVAADKMSSIESLKKSISTAIESLKKFTDFRLLCDVLLEIVQLLLTVQGGAGIETFVSGGGLKMVMEQLKKNQFHLNSQINGWKIIAVVALKDPQYAELIKKAGKK